MRQREFEITGNVLVRWNGVRETVVVPPEVEIIGEEAFQENPALREITLPETLREIRARAFEGCNRLARIRIPPRVTALGDQAFQSCSFLEAVELPAGLKRVGAETFQYCHSLRQVTLPPELEEIGEGAFFGCALESVRIPSHVTVVPSHSFEWCENLRSVECAEGVREIRRNAFQDCRCLRELHLPFSLETIEADAFEEYPRTYRLSFPALNPRLAPETLIMRLPAVCLKAPGTSIARIPASVRHSAILGLADWEYEGNTLSPELDADVVAYLKENWLGCLGEAESNPRLLRLLLTRGVLTRESADVLLRRMAGPDQVETTAGILAYINSLPAPDPVRQEEELLQELETGFLAPDTFDASWTAGRSNEGLVLREYHGVEGDVFVPAGRGTEPVVAIRQEAFRKCTGITSLAIPEGVRRIGAYLCARNATLRSVDLPSTLESIPDGAFAECTALSTVRMAPGPVAMGDTVFAGCGNLTEVDLPEGLARMDVSVFRDCVRLERVSLPDTLEELGACVFGGCSSLQELRLPASLRVLDYTALEGCASLTRLEVDPANPYFRTEGPFLLNSDGTVLLHALLNVSGEVTVPDGVKEIGAYCFAGCEHLTSVALPYSLERIGNSAFENCVRLNSVLPVDQITAIEACSFQNCASLTSISIPGSVRIVGERAFRCCGALASVMLEEGIQEVDVIAFEGCGSLTSIVFPKSLVSLKYGCFNNCAALREVTFLGIPKKLADSVLEDCDRLRLVRLPRDVPPGRFRQWLTTLNRHREKPVAIEYL